MVGLKMVAVGMNIPPFSYKSLEVTHALNVLMCFFEQKKQNDVAIVVRLH